MKITHQYSEEILEKKQQIEEYHTSNIKKTKALCKELVHIGELLEDENLLGFAYHYLALSYHFENKFQKFQEALVIGLKYQLRASDSELLARTYNVLGATAVFSTNNSQAMDYFITALRYAKKDNHREIIGIINGNIGNVYRELADYQKALDYLQLSLADIDLNPTTFVKQMDLTILYSNMAFTLLDLGEIEEAYYWYRKITFDIIHRDIQIALYIFEIRYFHLIGETKKSGQKLQQLLIFLEPGDFSWISYDDILFLCRFLQESGNVDALLQILSSLDRILKQSNLTKFKLQFLDYKIFCYEEKNWQPKLVAAYAAHYKLSKQLEKEVEESLRKDIHLREELEAIRNEHQQIQSENLLLLEKSRQDFLTSLPNREWAEEQMVLLYLNAIKHQTSMAIEVLDIDNFKCFNDTLGHQHGDRYLLMLAGLLDEMNDEDVFCARQGGDEFVILYHNKTTQEILAIAERLRQNVIQLSMIESEDHQLPMTISQGICHFTPSGDKTIVDYYQLADKALYTVKKKQKNDIYLTKG